MFTRHKAISIVMIVLTLVAGCGRSEPNVTATPPPPTETPISPTAISTATAMPGLVGTPRSLGFEPVTRNDDWTPYIEEFDGVEMALVPAGCFEMGSTDEQVDDAMRQCEKVRGAGNCERSWYQDEQPVQKQCFDEPFWIDVHEVTNVQYGSSGEWSGDELPREHVTWADAVVHCESRGARLPTEAEWEYAARGPDGLVFPWGNLFQRALVNSCDRSCEFNLIGTRVDDGYENTAPVGSYAGGASWVGAMDMSGNVWEWTSSIYMDYPYSATDGREVDGSTDSSSKRVLRGGSWFHSASDLLRSAARYDVSPDFTDYVVGFRCVAPFTNAPNPPMVTTVPPTDTPLTPTATPPPPPTATETPTPTPTVEPPSDEQILANLVAFARLYGYVRYFHPSDEAAGLNWERVAINGVAAVKDAREPADLAQKLQAFFQPCAPTLRVFPVDARPEVPAELSLPGDITGLRVVMWQHYGVEGELAYDTYHSDRISALAPGGEIPDGYHDPREPFYAELGGDVAALLPLALFADDAGTLPRIPVSRQDLPDHGVVPGISNQRLAGVVIAWNVFQHFYPYFDVVDTDWPQVLEDALLGTLAAADETAYHHVLRRLLAELHDGHAFILVQRSTDVYTPHVRLSWVEDSLVVLKASGKAADSLATGDVILKIDGQPAAQVLANWEELTSGATPQWKHERALRDLLVGPQGSEVRLEVETKSGEQKLVTLRRDVEHWTILPQGPRPQKVTELELGIMYVDLTRAVDEDFEAAMPQLEAARGIVFDLRGYPWVSIETLCHLLDAPVTSPQIYVPIVTYPDQQNVVFDRLSWELEPIAPRFKGKIAFLTDGQALSASETYLSIVEHYQLAEIVGEPTGGTNGARDQVSLPGGYICSWTGMKVLKHDGSQHHGVGIQPTIFVAPTIQGIREGRDEQLERAVEVVRQAP